LRFYARWVARKHRDQSEGVRHIWCRGNRRQPIFADDFDRERYLVLLGKVCRKLGWRVVAYCLMTNHVHLVIEVPADTLSYGMQLLSGQYAQAFNRRYGYVGHLFQGRFSASRVDDEAYGLQLTRYVVQNPTRAGMVEEAVDWRWSSHRAVLGKVQPPAFLDVEWTLSQFARKLELAREWYASFVDAYGHRLEERGQAPGQDPSGRGRDGPARGP
jgi:REP element-mobilizing transposase RayT